MRNRHRPLPRAFSLVEILIVVLLIGVLAAVAIPQLLNSGEVVGDRAAQAQIRTSALTAAARMADANTYAAPTGDATKDSIEEYLALKNPNITYVGATSASTLVGKARTVSSGVDAGGTTLVLASLGENGKCWGMRLTKGAADQFGVLRSGTCSATQVNSTATWQSSDFPATD